MNILISRIFKALAIFALLLATACGTIYKPAQSLAEVNSSTVMLVGKIQLRPKLEKADQDIEGTIFYDADDLIRNKAIFSLSGEYSESQSRTMEAFTPELEKTYFIVIPKSQRHIVRSSVWMEFDSSGGTPIELMLPAPIELDIRSSDQAIYLGTWRFHRDEFNGLNKAQMIDEYKSAKRELQKKFGKSIKLRKAMPKTK